MLFSAKTKLLILAKSAKVLDMTLLCWLIGLVLYPSDAVPALIGAAATAAAAIALQSLVRDEEARHGVV